MNGTPRLRSAFPASPTPARPQRRSNLGFSSATTTSAGESSRTQDLTALKPQNAAPATIPPVIAFDTIDAPSQRLYAAGIYVALILWRLYDFYNLTVDESESLWLFMKWVSIDGIFLFGLPSMRIPWLEWASSTMMFLFALHTFFNGILMFRIPIPLGAWLVAFTRVLYDREIAVSERRVKPADILHNPQLILGKQIINILPEGSAVLNPDKVPLCLPIETSSTTILPIQINQTTPTSIELYRFDFASSEPEIISISSSNIKKMRSHALKHTVKNENQPLLLNYLVKKPGLYRLGRIIDETKLEVQHAQTEAFVVKCPSATISHAGRTRCKGEFSNIAIRVEGTAPLKIKYRKSVNELNRDVFYQSIQPENFNSPLIRQKAAGPAVLYGDNDLTWARTHHITVPLNESLVQAGEWTYSIEEVADAFGNIQSYASQSDEYEVPKSKSERLEDNFLVLERPRAALDPGGQRSMQPIRVARGETVAVPVTLKHHDPHEPEGQEYSISYQFTPEADIRPDGQPSNATVATTFRLKRAGPLPHVKEAGLYSLQTVASDKCAGQIDEPSVFQLINPTEPQVQISKEDIHDKCAGRNIGLRMMLDFSGSPPYVVSWTEQKDGGKNRNAQTRRFDGPRGQIDLRPDEAGHYTYHFTDLSDNVYANQNLRPQKLIYEQSVRPSVSASFTDPRAKQGACLDQSLKYSVRLAGEGPWVLEYELVHGSRRDRRKLESSASIVEIETGPLTTGGEYSLALLGVTDKMGCRESLTQDVKIQVRHQKPRAGFGFLDGRQSISILQTKKVRLPVRLSGEGPWTVQYTFNKEGSDEPTAQGSERLTSNNDALEVRQPGQYEITAVRDNKCPGSVDEKSSKFGVAWIARPQISAIEGPQQRIDGSTVLRDPVCEGDDDAIDLSLHGSPPFEIDYQENIIPEKGSKALRSQHASFPGNSAQIRLNTNQAGKYEYVFSKVGDHNYDHDSKHHSPIRIEQQVYARPTAQFATSGKVYSFCQGDDSAAEESEKIPVILTGKPPFTVDLEIKHSGRASRAVPLSVPNIAHHKHELSIPHRLLQTGHSVVSIRRIRDARNCERLIDAATSPRVQISVHDSPIITANEPDRQHYCVGDRISFALSGITPFTVFYTFEGSNKRANSNTPTFRRLAETKGNFTITGVQDAGSSCQSRTLINKEIHELPSVRVNKGQPSRSDIHVGGSAEITFDFGGTPPFEFTFIRSENLKKGQPASERGAVLESRILESDGAQLKISASEEGTYEVVALRDRFCSFAIPGHEGELGKFKGGERLLGYY